MAEGRYIDPRDGKVKRGYLVVLQKVGTMPDGKVQLLAGRDTDTFNLEDNDEFFTAVFAVDPFAEVSDG